MPYKLQVPLVKTVTYAFDPDGETTGTYRQPSRHQVALHQQLIGRDSRALSTNEGMAFINPVTVEEAKAVEVWLTLIDCNLEDNKGKPLFKFAKRGDKTELNMTWEEFWAAWGKIAEPKVAQALWEGAMEVAPDWDTRPKNPEVLPGGKD